MSVVRFDGVAVEGIRIGAAVAIEIDTRTGRSTVRAATGPAATGLSVDASKGEWRCKCPPDRRFDTSVNLACFSACAACGARRP